MNNYQNNIPKFVLPPNIVPEYSDTFGNLKSEKKRREDGPIKETVEKKSKPSPALKFVVKADNVKTGESRFEGRVKHAKKKTHRDASHPGKSGSLEEKTGPKKELRKEVKKDGKKDGRKYQKQETGAKVGSKKPEYPNNVRVFKRTSAYDGETKNDLTQLHDITDKYGKKSGLEDNIVPVNNLFTFRKDHAEISKSAQLSKVDLSLIPAESTVSATLSNQKLLQKLSGKISQTSNVKATVSYCKKLQINEILKGHAQKVPAPQPKTYPVAKECSFQGVSELIQKVRNLSSSNVVYVNRFDLKKDSKGKFLRDDADNKLKVISFEKKRDKTQVEKDATGMVDKGAVQNEDEDDLDKYKIESEIWWEQEALEIDEAHTTLEESNVVEAKKSKTVKELNCIKSDEKVKEDDRKVEKRTTHTDRLLASRTLNKDDKKTGGVNEVQGKNVENAGVAKKPTDSHNNEDPLPKNSENLTLAHILSNIAKSQAPKEAPITSAGENKELSILGNERNNERCPSNEEIFKAKSTRSAELRDLVNHAVKEHKIFCIFDNHWYIVRPVREELLSRGWLEVIPDRRLIPRRRPPPMGPTYDRDKSIADRNCNTLEAILTAKENFADEIQETVSKSSSFKTNPEKPKTAPTYLLRKSSEESLAEAVSQFRIIPPTSEKRKNNFEIREFVNKYQSIYDCNKKLKEKDNAKERIMRNLRKDKSKSPDRPGEDVKGFKGKAEEKLNIESDISSSVPLTKSLQAILDTINDNKKTIFQSGTETNDSTEPKSVTNDLTIWFNNSSRNFPSIESKESKDKGKSTEIEAPFKVQFTENESKMISKIIQSTNARIHFMWLSIKPSIHLKCFNYSPEIVNKFQKTTFCTKIGLWNHLNNIQWYAHEVHFPAKSPRMYNTGEADDLQAFFQDFQMTACIGMLKWLSDTFFDRGIKAVQTKKGKVPLKAFEFAIKQCERYIRFKDNEDLSIMEEPKALQEEWNTFLQWFYIITNDHGKMQESSTAQLMVVYTKAVETLKTIKRHWPEIDIDGRLNIWIMKPYCASCGRGIFMTNNVYYIGQHSKYIVQKYIERPLLIYNTKFDIRQWFMITRLTPLEIWMYKECYLRFCTQPFALRNLHESVHLSNNSVQRKYVSFRDPGLPDQNMWDSNTFQIYLKTIGHPTVWQEVIYPGMRDAIVSTMLAAQDTFDGPRRNWFEVYGADFMISSNVKDGPWLIEINENPAMDPSTKVTSRLCPQMLRDVIKVVVDKRANKNASTGQWELVYRQNYSPSFGTVDLDVKGKKIARIPHAMKVNVNLPQHPSTSPVNGRGVRSNDDNENKKMYEVVKTFGATKNKDDVNFTLIKRDSKVKESENDSRKAEYNTSDSKMKKDKMFVVMQSLTNMDSSRNKTNQSPSETAKKDGVGSHEKQKSVAKMTSPLLGISGVSIATKIAKESKGEFMSGSLLEKPRYKHMHQNSSTTVPQKLKENKKHPSDVHFAGSERRKTTTGQNQSHSHLDKYKFTKFYKV